MKTNILPVITLYQPWATWIIRGWKTIETRTHDRFKGLVGKDILIHAGKRTDETAINNRFLSKSQILHNPDEIVNGAIIGKAHVYQSRELGYLDERAALIECMYTKRFGLFLARIEKLEEPIYVKGEMGIWYFDLLNKQKVLKNGVTNKADSLTLFQ